MKYFSLAILYLTLNACASVEEATLNTLKFTAAGVSDVVPTQDNDGAIVTFYGFDIKIE